MPELEPHCPPQHHQFAGELSGNTIGRRIGTIQCHPNYPISLHMIEGTVDMHFWVDGNATLKHHDGKFYPKATGPVKVFASNLGLAGGPYKVDVHYA
jgi:hypothetical protein